MILVGVGTTLSVPESSIISMKSKLGDELTSGNIDTEEGVGTGVVGTRIWLVDSLIVISELSMVPLI